MSAGAAIAIRRKRLVRRFREVGATDQDHAITLESVGERPSWIFDQMVLHGVFLAASGGRYYLDDQAATKFLLAKRIRAMVIAGVLLLLLVVLWVFGVFKR